MKNLFLVLMLILTTNLLALKVGPHFNNKVPLAISPTKISKATSQPRKYSQRFETYEARQTIFGGFKFHIAEYADGTKIITCLDGTEKGLQSISCNGMTQTESRAVQWNKDTFIHFYEHGRVISYPRRQIVEFY